MTIGAAVLQNELSHRVPAAFLENFPQGAAIAYAVIPQVPSLPEPLKRGVQDAFAATLRVVWRVFIGIAAAGFVCSLFMEGLPLHSALDKEWAPPVGSGSGDDASEEKDASSAQDMPVSTV